MIREKRNPEFKSQELMGIDMFKNLWVLALRIEIISETEKWRRDIKGIFDFAEGKKERRFWGIV